MAKECIMKNAKIAKKLKNCIKHVFDKCNQGVIRCCIMQVNVMRWKM